MLRAMTNGHIIALSRSLGAVPMLCAAVLVTCLAAAATARPETVRAFKLADKTFDAQVLARQLSQTRFGKDDALKPPFGAPGVTTMTAPTDSRKAMGVEAIVTVPADGRGTKSGIEYWVFGTPVKARDTLTNHALLGEMLVPDGSKTTTVRAFPTTTLTGSDGQTFVLDDIRCGVPEIPQGGSANQIRCLYVPARNQLAVVAYSYGTAFREGESLRAIKDAAFEALTIGLRKARIAQDAVSQARPPAPVPLRPAAPLDPDALAQRLAQIRFDHDSKSERLAAPFGRPAPGTIQPATKFQREKTSLRSKVIIAANGQGTESGLEFWIFTTPSQAQKAMKDSQLIAPWMLVPASVKSVRTKFMSFEPVDGSGPGLKDVECSGAKPAPGTVARQLRCRYLPDGSQAAVVAYSYGLDVSSDEAFSKVAGPALYAIMVATRKLHEAMAAVPPSSPEAAPALDPVLVGTWETFVPHAHGKWRWTLEIAAEGSYVFRQDGVFGHQGSFEAKDGKWSLRSKTSDWFDGGRYALPDARTFSIIGRLGPSRWQRVGS